MGLDQQQNEKLSNKTAQSILRSDVLKSDNQIGSETVALKGPFQAEVICWLVLLRCTQIGPYLQKYIYNYSVRNVSFATCSATGNCQGRPCPVFSGHRVLHQHLSISKPSGVASLTVGLPVRVRSRTRSRKGPSSVVGIVQNTTY